MSGDYGFRYPIGPPAPGAGQADVLGEFARAQLAGLLDIVVPCCGDAGVKVDGFRFLGPDRGRHGLYDARRPAGDQSGDGGNGSDSGVAYQNMANAGLYEPRIEYIARQLRNILSLVELEIGGKPVKVDGFRLRNPEDWAGSQVASPSDILLQTASRCDLNCVFCYNRGSLDSLEWPHHRSEEEELHELGTRLRYYNPAAGKGIFPTYGSPCEPLADPRALHVLTELREKTAAAFRLCTNGARLDEPLVTRLAALAPIHLDISLNSASPERRAALMGDDNPQVAIASLARLKEHCIPYSVTVVVWPLPSLPEALDDLARTAAWAADNLAALIQVNLPGYTRFQYSEPPFNSGEVWRSTVAYVHELRENLPCPIVVRPSLYEENATRERKNLAEIIGTVPGSPAARCGLMRGDLLERVNGVPVRNRAQARDLLTIVQDNGGTAIELAVKRGDREVELGVDPGDHGYPFDPRTVSHLGVVFMGGGFRESYLERMREILLVAKPREALLLSSLLVRPTLEQMLMEHPLYVPEGTRLRIEVPENKTFGGNIIMGDLLLVQDFIACIKGYLERSKAPGLILIPSSPFHLSGWRRDLTGRPYLDIEREVGIPVSLIECDPILD